MSTLLFLLTIIIVLLIYIFVRHKYVEDFKIQKSKRKREQRVKNYIYNAFKIGRIEALHYKSSHVELIYRQKTITVRKDQIIFVNYEHQEKVETKFNMPSDIDRSELLDLIMENTYFYMTENRYFTLMIKTKK